MTIDKIKKNNIIRVTGAESVAVGTQIGQKTITAVIAAIEKAVLEARLLIDPFNWIKM